MTAINKVNDGLIKRQIGCHYEIFLNADLSKNLAKLCPKTISNSTILSLQVDPFISHELTPTFHVVLQKPTKHASLIQFECGSKIRLAPAKAFIDAPKLITRLDSTLTWFPNTTGFPFYQIGVTYADKVAKPFFSIGWSHQLVGKKEPVSLNLTQGLRENPKKSDKKLTEIQTNTAQLGNQMKKCLTEDETQKQEHQLPIPKMRGGGLEKSMKTTATGIRTILIQTTRKKANHHFL